MIHLSTRHEPIFRLSLTEEEILHFRHCVKRSVDGECLDSQYAGGLIYEFFRLMSISKKKEPIVVELTRKNIALLIKILKADPDNKLLSQFQALVMTDAGIKLNQIDAGNTPKVLTPEECDLLRQGESQIDSLLEKTKKKD